MILKMFTIMREKSQEFLNNKKSAQEQEVAAAQTVDQSPAQATRMGKIMDMIYANS